MRVKRYVVDELPQAIELIRQELGKDAIIIDSKPIYIGGFLGLFRKKKIEVTAAIEQNSVTTPKGEEEQSKDVNQLIAQILKVADHTATEKRSSNHMVVTDEQATVNRNREQIVPPSATISSEQLIMNELKEMRTQLQKINRSEQMEAHQLQPLEDLKLRLQQQEVEAETIEQLCEEILIHLENEQVQLPNDAITKQYIWEQAAIILQRWLAPYGVNGIDEDTEVVFLLGATGVGKTTTIAKLAAQYKISLHKQAGFITSDTYRIAAVDQLRTYATILNIPLEVVVSQSDVARAHEQLAAMDIVFMDTAGRNYQHDLQISEVISLTQTTRPSEKILVLSLTAKSSDMSTMTERFLKYGVTKVLFTKLDETSVYGSILNLVRKYEVRPTFVTKGQTVPDDINTFAELPYIELLLGDADDE
ncbi:flagellar biosynthesis protein FlhF [Paenibacillus yanchengensis]|uniref:Flagellar biosynthesis protein FlhF n=1 Tax=Paenibacillus yanchengensis TaxID=2035833 RepID=A0ABW4YM45_9BACL